MNDAFLLSAIIFLPAIGALLLGLFNYRSENGMRSFANAVTGLTLILTLFMAYKFQPGGTGEMQMQVNLPWIALWNVNYQLGVDGISMPLIVLTAFISWLAMLASGSVTRQVRGYLILFLLLETGMFGVFLSLDFFLFY